MLHAIAAGTGANQGDSGHESVDQTYGELSRLFRPRSVALVGVSGQDEKLIARPLRFLVEHGFAGSIYPVNPNYQHLRGLPCYPSLQQVPGPVDVVLVLVPAADTVDVVRQAGAIGATAAVVFASGFAETGMDGAALQNQLREVAHEAGVRVLGPNCQGFLYAPAGLPATFTAAADRELGSDRGVAYVGQSGAVGGSVLDLASEMGLGLTAWVSTGNQADVDLVEVATALVQDQAIQVVMLYAETIADGAAYTGLAREAHAAGKHLVLLRSGRSDAGRRAAFSHTGSMLGDDTAFVLTSKRYGVILVDDVDELLAVAATVASVSRAAGQRVGVITTSGGAGSLAADHCASHGLDLPELTQPSQDKLAPLVPEFGALANPVDVTAQLFNRAGHARALGQVCTIVADDPNIDAVAVVLTMVTGEAGTAVAHDLVDTAVQLGKPVLVAWLAGVEQTSEGRKIFQAAGMPVFGSVGDLARTTGSLVQPQVAPPIDTCANTMHESTAAALIPGFLSGTVSSDQVLRALDISYPRSMLTTTAAHAATAADQCGGPVAMKVHAPSLAHKSDIGGVCLNVPNNEVTRVFDELAEVAFSRTVTDFQGVLVQEMSPAGPELIVGATSTAEGYAPVVTVGMGGVTTELYGDVASELAPLDPQRAEEMLRSLHGWPLLAGFRGAPPTDVPAVVDAVVAVSHMIANLSDEAIQFEINPIIVAADGGGVHAVDLYAHGQTNP